MRLIVASATLDAEVSVCLKLTSGLRGQVPLPSTTASLFIHLHMTQMLMTRKLANQKEMLKKQKRSFLLFDGKKFHDFFNQNESGDPAKDTCGILTVEGRTFPVDVFYTVR